MKVILSSVYFIFLTLVVPFMCVFGGLAEAQAPTDTFVTITYVPTATLTMTSTTSSSDVDTFTRTSSTQTHIVTSPTTTTSGKPTQTAGASIMKWDVDKAALGAACGVAAFFIAMA